MNIEEVLARRTPKQRIQMLFDANPTKVYTSNQIAKIFKAETKVNYQNVSGSLVSFPSVMVGKIRIYGHAKAIKKYVAKPELLEEYQPIRYWIDKLFKKFPDELFQPKDVSDRIREAFNVTLQPFSLRTCLSVKTSVVIGAAGRGYYGSPAALEQFKKALEKRGATYTVIEREGGKDAVSKASGRTKK